ncbi:MAG TPA: 2'-5' RNA ligase family protein [Patescibacteria group bacterium]
MAAQQYYVGIGLPDKEEKLFSFVKQQFNPDGNLSSPAHITLIPPFFTDKEKDLAEKLNNWSANQTVFEIEFKKVDSFKQSKYATIFLAPENGEKLLELWLSLKEKIDGKIKREFVPHLTLAQRVDYGEYENIFNKIIDMQLCLELEINSVILYRRKSGESWHPYREFLFGKEINKS